jgi:MurNAc alpha-1-phosphate uridylyltransferase
MTGAMILAAGRGDRMRPLSDATPKPLLPAGGKPLIVWQVEALARAGYRRIVINAAHLASQMIEVLGDGGEFGVHLDWSVESEPLETAGGIATAMPLLPPGPVLVVSGDVWTTFDYTTLDERAAAMAATVDAPRAHFVMVANPPFHPAGDFALVDGTIREADTDRLTFGNIAVYDTALFRELPRGVKLKLLPLFRDWIARGWVSGERFDGLWDNVGTPSELAALDRRLAANRAAAF